MTMCEKDGSVVKRDRFGCIAGKFGVPLIVASTLALGVLSTGAAHASYPSREEVRAENARTLDDFDKWQKGFEARFEKQSAEMNRNFQQRMKDLSRPR